MLSQKFILLSFITCILSICSCGKVKTVKKAEFPAYNRICTNELLKENIGNICATIGSNSGACVDKVNVRLKDETNEVKRFQYHNVLICYGSDGRPEQCVTGYNEETNGLVWIYSAFDVACKPEKSVPKLLNYKVKEA